MFGHCLFQTVKCFRTTLFIANCMAKGAGNTLTKSVCLWWLTLSLLFWTSLLCRHRRWSQILHRILQSWLPSNAQSYNTCPLSLTLNVATLSKLVTRNGQSWQARQTNCVDDIVAENDARWEDNGEFWTPFGFWGFLIEDGQFHGAWRINHGSL